MENIETVRVQEVLVRVQAKVQVQAQVLVQAQYHQEYRGDPIKFPADFHWGIPWICSSRISESCSGFHRRHLVEFDGGFSGDFH